MNTAGPPKHIHVLVLRILHDYRLVGIGFDKVVVGYAVDTPETQQNR